MSKMTKSIAGILLLCMIFCNTVRADGSALIMETYTGETYLSVYVKGTDAAAQDISVQIATTEAEGVTVQSIADRDVSMRTLVMIDNSLSIPAADRDKIAEFLQNLISDRLANEEISIATFSESVNKLTDYTADYTTLKTAIDSITYQDQETYLTDVLYDLLAQQYMQNMEDIYCRIIVISDGVDNKSLGYTKEELYALLKEIKIPVYAIGCSDSNNNEELENMFALSRMTGASYFLMEETENLLDITGMLNQDRTIVRLQISPSEEMMDGSKKSVKITLPDGCVLTTESLMPQQLSVKEPEEEPVIVEEPVIEEPMPEPETVPVEEPESIPALFIIAGIIVIVLITAVITGILLLMKKRRSVEPEFEAIDDNLLRELQNNNKDSEGRTEIIGSFQNRNNDDGSTVMIWNQNVTYQVVLTDINSPVKSFQVPLHNSIVVGRKKESCDIALDYEKSVSGKHCEIIVRDGRFYIKDLQSSNGTYVNDSKILTETEIFTGNALTFGRLKMRFEVR